MANDEFLARYADLLIGTCLNLERGMRLLIRCEIPNRELARRCAESAWKRGARDVKVRFADRRIERCAIESMDEAWLDGISKFEKSDSARLAKEGWAYLWLLGEEDPEYLEGVNAARVQRWNRARSVEFGPYLKALVSDAIPWCVAPAPTEAWARWTFEASGREMPADPAAALWKALFPMLRMDSADPSKAWLADSARLEARAALMMERRFDSLRFSGPGTDLLVGLSPRSRWKSAVSGTLGEGRRFTPNIPSEEIFTTPDARRTEGRAALTRPVRVNGVMVEGAWFRFEHGEAVESGAARNAEALSRHLASDLSLRRLGEVALVECTNPVAESGLVFGNVLLDENAACHIALGFGYEPAFEGAGEMDGKTREAAGFNEAIDHIDFMIGSKSIDVDGLDAAGNPTAVMRSGRFAL
jgi:aminopeptidase